MNELEKLAVYINEFTLDNVPEDVIETAKICILDSYAVSVGSSEDELIKNVVKEYKDYYSDGPDQISIWGQETKLPVLQAIFINSLKGHRLELDDVHTKSKTHIGTVVVPTALGLGEWLGSTGKEIIEAVVCGYEVMSRIGMGFGVSSHRNKGWHVTSTAGTFGAAAAAAKLLKLDVEQISNALGMAGTQSFGLWAFLEDSASSKILHPGRASQSGTEAAILAKSGMTGPKSILDAKDGSIFEAMSDEYDLSIVSKDLGVVYETLYVDNKPYPCCRSTHCTIDSALKLRKENQINIDEIDEIIVDTYLVGYKQCGLTEGSKSPVTPTEAKFSTPYTVSTALIYGEITLDHFKEENIANEAVQSLLKKVKVQANDKFTDRYPDHWGCSTKIRMINGIEYEVEVKDALGSTFNPVSKEAIRNKVSPLLGLAYENPDKVIDKLLNLEKY